MIPIAKPYIGQEEKGAVMEVLSRGQLAQGTEVGWFEEEFAAFNNVRYCVAVNSGTSALIAIMLASGIRRGDRVLIPSFSFFATCSAILAVGAQPVFVDIESDTFNMSLRAAIEANLLGVKAVMPVDLYGRLANMPRFKDFCDRNDLLLFQDSCQSHGAHINGEHPGTWGPAAVSFYATKNMMCGEGGAILTNDSNLAERLRMIRNQGMSSQYRHEILGYNLRMTNISAAICRCQLRRLKSWNAQRLLNAATYNTRLVGVAVPELSDGHVFHQYTVRFPSRAHRDRARRILNEKGIGARVYYEFAIHTQPAVYKAMGYPDSTLSETVRHWNNKLPETMRAADTVLSLPVHPQLTPEELEYVVQEVNSLC